MPTNTKHDVLCDLCETFGTAQVLVFCNLRRTVEGLSEQLTGHGILHAAMHGDMMAIDRAAIMAEFRAGSTRILLATNLLARGLDREKQSSQLVVNYDLPAKHDEYIHRTSPDGRGVERKPITINLTTADDVGRISELEQHYNTQIEETSIGLLARGESSLYEEESQT